MTRFPRATSSRLLPLLLFLAVPGAAVLAQDAESEGEGGDPNRTELTIPAGEAPRLDGKLEDGEWDGAARFTVRQGEEKHGEGWARRARRQLYLAVRSDFEALGLGLRFNFRDPGTQARVQVLVVPLAPPRSPVVVYREPAEQPPERLSGVGCDASFEFSPERGFTMELRVPLDLIAIGRGKGRYGFGVEIWDIQAEQPLAAFPLDGGFGAAEVTLVSVGDWGADVPADEPAPPANRAIGLLERIETEGLGKADGAIPVEDTLFAYMGWRDGRRRDAPLARLQRELAEALAVHPDYASLRAALLWVHLGRGDPEAAYAVHRKIGELHPLIGRSVRHVLLECQLLRGLGRHADAVRLLEGYPRYLQDPLVGLEYASLKTLRRALEIETALRAAEAERDDLPRVRLHVAAADGTPRGTILLELFEDDAPNAVANFIALAARGFYAGTRFHWVEGGRRVIAGDPNSRDDDPENDGFGGPGYRIESEPSRRLNLGYAIGFSDERGVRRSEGSSFILQMEAFPALDGVNSVFGRVIEGFETLRAIEYYDVVTKAEVVRKREHEYAPVKRPR